MLDDALERVVSPPQPSVPACVVAAVHANQPTHQNYRLFVDTELVDDRCTYVVLYADSDDSYQLATDEYTVWVAVAENMGPDVADTVAEKVQVHERLGRIIEQRIPDRVIYISSESDSDSEHDAPKHHHRPHGKDHQTI